MSAMLIPFPKRLPPDVEAWRAWYRRRWAAFGAFLDREDIENPRPTVPRPDAWMKQDVWGNWIDPPARGAK